MSESSVEFHRSCTLMYYCEGRRELLGYPREVVLIFPIGANFDSSPVGYLRMVAVLLLQIIFVQTRETSRAAHGPPRARIGSNYQKRRMARWRKCVNSNFHRLVLLASNNLTTRSHDSRPNYLHYFGSTTNSISTWLDPVTHHHKRPSEEDHSQVIVHHQKRSSRLRHLKEPHDQVRPQ